MFAALAADAAAGVDADATLRRLYGEFNTRETIGLAAEHVLKAQDIAEARSLATMFNLIRLSDFQMASKRGKFGLASLLWRMELLDGEKSDIVASETRRCRCLRGILLCRFGHTGLTDDKTLSQCEPYTRGRIAHVVCVE